jgi:hypothetical protein
MAEAQLQPDNLADGPAISHQAVPGVDVHCQQGSKVSPGPVQLQDQTGSGGNKSYPVTGVYAGGAQKLKYVPPKEDVAKVLLAADTIPGLLGSHHGHRATHERINRLTFERSWQDDLPRKSHTRHKQ